VLIVHEFVILCHRYLSNIDSVLLWNLVTTFVKKSAPKFSVWPQLFKFLYQFTFWIVLIFLIFFLFLSPNLIFAFWNATWWHFKIFHKNLNLRFLFNNLSHWWSHTGGKVNNLLLSFRNWLWLVFSCHMYLMPSLYYLYVYGKEAYVGVTRRNTSEHVKTIGLYTPGMIESRDSQRIWNGTCLFQNCLSHF